MDTDLISEFLKVFVICFVCHGYLIFRFALLQKNMDIRENGSPENKYIFADIYEYLRISHMFLLIQLILKAYTNLFCKIFFLHDIYDKN